MIGTRSPVPLLAVLTALLAALLGPLYATPAAADAGTGRAAVKVQRLVVEPHGAAWHARVTLINNNSGDRVRGAKVTAALGDGKAVTLSRADVAGEFTGMLAGAKPGAANLILKVRGVPGADALLPFDGQWNVRLTAGESAAVVGGSAGGEGGGSTMPAVLGGLGGAAALGLLYWLYRARRGTSVPAAVR